MSATVWTKFFWSDWANDPALRLCSLAAQGLWMRMLCIAAEADPTGYVTVNSNALDETDLARLTGASGSEVADLLGELERNGVFSRDRNRRIYSRRMVRDAKRAAQARKNGKQGGNPSLRKDKGNPARDNPKAKGLDKTHKPEAKSQKPEEESTATSEQDAPRGPPASAHAAQRWTREEVDRVTDACISAAEINGQSPAWPECSAILGLVEAGYDLEAEILPSIRAQTQRLGKPAGSPRYYVAGIREAAERRQGQASVPKPGGTSDDEWRKRLDRWHRTGKWSEARTWGAPPGEPGCIVPKHILAESKPPLRAVSG